MRAKHRVRINVSSPGGKTPVLEGGIRTLPSRLVRFLFGEATQIYVMAPGKTIDSVEIRELKGDRSDETL